MKKLLHSLFNVRVFSTFLIFIIFFFLAHQLVYAANLITNPEFTTNTTGWTAGSATLTRRDFSSSPNIAPTGGTDNFGLEVATTSTNGQAKWAQIASNVGDWYIAKVQAYSPSANTAVKDATLFLWDSTASNITKRTITAEDTWQPLVLTGRAVDSKVQFAIRDATSTSGDKSYFDAADLELLSLSSLITSPVTLTNDFIASVTGVNNVTATQEGLALNLDSSSNPQNGVFWYFDTKIGSNNLFLDKLVNGVWSNVATISTGFTPNAVFQVRKSGTTYVVYYNGAVKGTYTISDSTIINNTIHAVFNTWSGNTLSGFSVLPHNIYILPGATFNGDGSLSTAAASAGAPGAFNSFTEVNAFSSGNTGDLLGTQILLARGSSIESQLYIANGSNFIVDAYGTGAQPIISGARPFSHSWTQEGNLWYTAIDSGKGYSRGFSVNGTKLNGVANKTDLNSGTYKVWYDSPNSRHYIVLDGITDPNGATIEANSQDPTQLYVLKFSNDSNFRVSNVYLEYAYDNNLSTLGTGNTVEISNITSVNAGGWGGSYGDDGINVYGNNTGGATGVVIKNNTSSNNMNNGIELWGLDGATITQNTLDKNGGSIEIWGYVTNSSITKNIGTNNKVDGQTASQNTGRGIWGTSAAQLPPDTGNNGNNTIAYNIIANSYFRGIRIEQGTGWKIYNNVLYETTNTGSYVLEVINSGTSVTFSNNIIATLDAPGTLAYLGANPGDVTVAGDNNLFYSYVVGNLPLWFNGTDYSNNFSGFKTAIGQTNSINSNPNFISSSDFHLQSTSPAIDAGTNVSLTTDYAGTSVPQGSAPDIGAYEYVPLTVTINQAGGQADPTNSSTINFTVVFSESVSDFITGDVTLSGTAGATTGTVTGSGTTYNIAVTGMTGSGTVIASLAAGVATGATENTNATSTSTDNIVTYDNAAPTLSSKTTFSGWYASNQTSTFTYTDGSGSGIASGTPVTCNITTEGSAQTCSVTPNVCDAVGNCNTTLVTSNGADIDKTAPAFSSKTTFSGWYASNQTSTFTYTDGSGSGIASGTPVTCNITTEGSAQTCSVTPNVCDAVGNCNTTLVTSNGADIDKTAPTGESVSYTDGYYTTTSIVLTVGDGTDTGSGINTSSRIVQRRSATLASGTCGGYGSWGTIVTSGTYPSFTDAAAVPVASGNCYQYQYLVSDLAGNQATYTSTNTAKVDTSLPSTPGTPVPSPSSPTNQTSQTWSWTAATDAISGIASYAWRTTGTAILSGVSLTNSVITSLAEGVYNFFVKALDLAGNYGSESSNSLTVDTTTPTGGSIGYTDGYFTTASVALIADDGSDGSGSGINTSSRIVQRKSATLTVGTCGGYGSFGTITPTGTYPNFTDSTVVSGNCYQYRYLVSDNAANQAIYVSSNTAKVDTTSPDVTINQAVGQVDPTNNSPINFTVVFTEPVSDFATGDVDLTGTGGATTGTVTGSGTTYNVAVTGMTGSGTVIASIAVNKAHDVAGNANTVSTSTDNSVTYSIDGPTLTSITISDSSGFTNSATPTITIVSSGSPTNVAFSCNAGTNWSSWIAYASTISTFNITNGATGCTTSDGSKTIDAKLKDSVGNESGLALDTTFYDTTGPTGSITNGGGDPTNDTTPTLNLTIADSGVGITGAEMMRFSCDNSTWTNWEAYVTPKTDFNIKPGVSAYGCGTTDGARIVYVEFRDSLQNAGASYNTGSFTLDTIPPVLTSITITDTSGFTNSPTPTITIVSSGSPSNVAFSCNGGTNYSSWIAYSDTISSFNTTNGATGCITSDGSKTVTAKLKDSAGNESGTSSDTTFYDTTAPTGGSIDYIDGDYATASVALTADDGSDGSGSGINTATRTIQRKSATLTSGSCGSYGSFSTITPTGTYPDFTDDTVSSGNCYQFQYLVSDNLGAQATYISSNTAKVDVPTPTPTATPASNNNTSSSSSTPVCNDTASKGLPDLFEIRTTKNSATLYFAPPAMPYSNFYIAYSRKIDIWEYAVQYNQGYSPGVLQYTINSLNPNTKYFFIIKPGNGCDTGNWSNTMAANTTQGLQKKNYYKNFVTSIVQKTKAIFSSILTTKKITNNLVPAPTQAPQVFVNIPTSAPRQIPTYVPVQTFVLQPTPTPKPKFCFLWWCF